MEKQENNELEKTTRTSRLYGWKVLAVVGLGAFIVAVLGLSLNVQPSLQSKLVVPKNSTKTH